MPYGARTSLAALIVSLALTAPAAWAEPGSTWTDPPARKPAAVTSPAEARTPTAPSASTPAATAPVAARKAVAARPAPQRMATHRAASAPKSALKPAPMRVAATAPRSRVATAPARVARLHRMVATAPPPPPQSRYWSDGYGPGYGSGYADDRLERLRAAEAAGYMVVHRRTVQYPDGRSLRVYRPDDEGEPY